MTPETQLDPAPAKTSGLGWTSATIVIAVSLLAVFNAASLQSWTAQQPPGPAMLTVRSLAENWARTTAALGLASPRAAVANLWNAAQGAGWPRNPPPPGSVQR